MPELSWTFLSGDLFRDKKADALVRYVLTKMKDECKDGTAGLNAYSLCKEMSTQNKALGESMIVFFLHEGSQVLSTAFVAWCNQVTYRWTPVKHRGKGYATEILRRIQALYATCPETLLFVASNPVTFNSNKRAGWVPSEGRVNPDGSQDWYPPEKKALYERRLQHQDAGDCSNISDVYRAIERNKNSDWADKETEAYMKLKDGWGNKRKVVATLRC
jgi:hypothetical protein